MYRLVVIFAQNPAFPLSTIVPDWVEASEMCRALSRIHEDVRLWKVSDETFKYEMVSEKVWREVAP